jgi:asparagine N-glycosylation enzyme membrane subunit Stt3
MHRDPSRRFVGLSFEPMASFGGLVRLIEPIFITFLGAWLGLVDQAAADTSLWLRAPALVAALLLVAQGLLDLDAFRRGGEQARQEERVLAGTGTAVTETVEIVEPGRATHRELWTTTKQPLREAVTDNSAIAFGVMGLAGWLGFATLTFPNAPRTLIVLALISAFLLFSSAWQVLLRGRS